MPVNAVSAAAASTVAPIVRRSTPAVQELFRHGTLYQPSPPSVVAEHLRSHPSAPKSAAASRFSGYYKPDGVSVPASGIVTNPSGRQPLTDMHSTDNMEEEIARRNRRLTILFTWLGAKEKYANKYIDLWTRRGNAVLHVTCSIKDMLMPKTGAEVTAARVKEHICSLGERSRVVVHGLSVGGYITQHVLKDNDVGVTSKLSHQIYDSFTNVEGLPQGVENAVPPRFSQIAKKIGQLYQRYADMSSFNESRNFILQGEANTPVFFMHSLADRVAQYEVTQPLIAALQAKTSVDVFLVPAEEQIPHVALLRCMGPPAYMELIETFLHHHPDPVY
ncbi:uncharacterized protein LOC108679781 [Hyalella azteca]|uniref:Uncharacterized protein LOC108679781 n=1 Tax=Hyalella azteca TaxID=294128 RepID=A0A8B7PCX6_HYAAZ|nr:uncharacterized protein LOC108679781 [Hyalella azteca]